MLRNYLKIALRNLKRNKGYAFFNVFGLALGMACCALVYLYVQDELSYDGFHEKAERIYRVNLEAVPSIGMEQPIALTPNIVGPLLTREFAQVEKAVRLNVLGGIVNYNEKTFEENVFVFADSTFFDIFSFQFVAGDRASVLNRPNTVVLTESAARRYFGQDNPLDKTIIYNNSDALEVTGVIEDMPANAHFQFDFLAPWTSLGDWHQEERWGSANYYTYVLLRENVNAAALEEKIDRRVTEFEHAGEYSRSLALMPVTDVHLATDIAYALDPTGDMQYVYIFSAIVVLILLIAGINYMNLATARATQRAKEVGVRKTAGARRGQLAGQFLMEAILVSAVAVLLALALTQLALPAMNALSGKELNLELLFSGWTLAAVVGLALFIGLFAGSYPAFVLSGFQPATVLKGSAGSTGGGGGLRRALVIFQFAVSIVLIVGTIIIQGQLDYLQSANLGLDKERVAVLHLSSEARANHEAIGEAFLQHSDVQSVSAVNQYPSALGWTGSAHGEGVPEEPAIMAKGFITDGDAVETLGIQLIAGRDFHEAAAHPDSVENGYRYLLNETLVHRLGWKAEEAVGKQFMMGGRDGRVIGVVADFHYASLREAIEPLAIWYHPGRVRNLLVRLAPGALEGGGDALAFMEERWTQIAPSIPFNYSFLDDEFDEKYRSERQVRSVFSVFAALAILIACLGLFGLATFAAERRTKEIGIRKVLGASVPSLVALLSKEFLKLVGIAFLIAAPLAWFVMNRWLQDFAYRIELGAGVFVLAGVLAVLIALATVSYQAIRAALADPVNALRSE